MNRDELIEVGYAALDAALNRGDPGPLMGLVIDAVEPLIRADERERTVARETDKHIATLEWNRQAALAGLRVKVEALKATPPEYEPVELTDGYVWGYAEARRNVLALLDGTTDD